MKILVQLTRAQCEEVAALMHRTKSRIEAQRCRIALLLAQGNPPKQVQEKVGCVRSTIYMTAYRIEDEGLDGLLDKRLGSQPRKTTPEVREQLLKYVDESPKTYGWQRSTWTLELFALQLREDTGVELSTSRIGQVLREEKCRRGRPRPALRIPVRGRREVLENIGRLVSRASPEEEVLFGDEADIDLNPRIGLTYIRRGHQPLVLTPGTNVKYYVAGALNTRTGNVIYSHGPKKNSELFIGLLDVLRRSYRRAEVVHLVLDNYIIHKSQRTRRALEELDGRIRIHFLPPYSPEHNPIERLWKQLHDNVTRNHRHSTTPPLWSNVTQFLNDVQPFPGQDVSSRRLVA